MSHDVHADVGAYAVGALTPPEREAFEAHLPHCGQCTREVAEFAETTAELARLAATPPPPELRERVLGAVRHVRPLPPTTDEPGDAATPATGAVLAGPAGSAPAGSRATGPRRAVATAGGAVDAENTSGDRDAAGPGGGAGDELATRRRRRGQRVLPLLVAAAVVVALALGGWVVTLRQQLVDVTTVAGQESELLAAADLEVVDIELPDGGRASYAVSREQDRVMLAAPALSDAPEGRAYQLWTMQLDETGQPVEDTIEPHDVFAGGQDVRVFFDGLRETDALAITVEDEAGATSPNMSTIFGLAPV